METAAVTDFIIIGAGLSGICALLKVRQKLPNAKVTVFEKGESVGGTWAKNTYPGLHCDIPSQLYSYSFALNPQWSSIYASQSEILSYIENTVRSSGSSQHVHLKQECIGAEWQADEYFWRVNVIDRESGQTYSKNARFLITAVGFCDTPNGTDDISGVEDFTGRIFHSSQWDHSFDFEGKDVVVIGNGCSANQFVPYLVNQASVRSLAQLVRSPHWIAPKENGPAPLWQRWIFQTFPACNRLWRYWLAMKQDLAFVTFKTGRVGTFLRKVIQKHLKTYMLQSAPREYHELLTPDFNLGAKRPVLDHGYFKALHDPRVKLLRSSSLAIAGPHEIRVNGGEPMPADVIILANGFKTQEPLTPMRITGYNGAELPAVWQQEANYFSAYMGVCVAGFPNLFLLTGPNTLPSGHSTLIGIECSVEYIIRLIKPLTKNLDASKGVRMEIKSSAQNSFNDRILEKMQRLVYTASVRNWYLDKRSGRNTLIWPGSQLAFWWSRCVRRVSWEDFEVEFKDRN